MDRVHKQLAELYPDYVALKTKINKSGKLKGIPFTACHIQWAKAWKDAVKKQKESSLEDFL
jgi:hypothetical protein